MLQIIQKIQSRNNIWSNIVQERAVFKYHVSDRKRNKMYCGCSVFKNNKYYVCIATFNFLNNGALIECKCVCVCLCFCVLAIVQSK